jgi:hypothetical protein
MIVSFRLIKTSAEKKRPCQVVQQFHDYFGCDIRRNSSFLSHILSLLWHLILMQVKGLDQKRGF